MTNAPAPQPAAPSAVQTGPAAASAAAGVEAKPASNKPAHAGLGVLAAAKKGGKGKKKSEKPDRLTAATADRHRLYEAAVQCVEAEIDFIDQTFRTIRGRDALLLREDFCGTGNTSCEWVKRRATNRAVGLDIDEPTLQWGRDNNIAALPEDRRGDVTLINRDVLTPGDATGADCILAMNFSYWLFQKRSEMIAYFKTVLESLGDEGVFFLDHYGGSESMAETTDVRKCRDHLGRKFSYEWVQHSFNPITGEMHCRIHFTFTDGTRIDDAFTYTWRLWTLPEIQEMLSEAGFKNVTVHWEGDELDDDGEPTGEGNGEFTPSTKGTADPAFISYITAER